MIRSDRCQVSTQLTQERGNHMRRKRLQKRQFPVDSQERASSNVGCFLLGGRRAKVQDARPVLSDVEVGSRGRFLVSLREINSGSARSTRPVYMFEQYTNDVYLPFCRRTWKESTAGTSEQIVKSHLVPEFGRALLSKGFGARRCRTFLTERRSISQESVVSHLRWFLNGIFQARPFGWAGYQQLGSGVGGFRKNVSPDGRCVH